MVVDRKPGDAETIPDHVDRITNHEESHRCSKSVAGSSALCAIEAHSGTSPRPSRPESWGTPREPTVISAGMARSGVVLGCPLRSTPHCRPLVATKSSGRMPASSE
ncbi:hypothetical protein Pd630_LPD04392 [Rhodococcus opacus PD630]|nr:hypothetical protein Pd630_LPD04392 [Rhodococcus opacus PD630]